MDTRKKNHELYRGKSMDYSGQDFDYFRYDPKDLDILLSEVVLLNTRAELYLRFIKRRSAVSLIKNKNLTQIRNGMDLF
jgi:hypothetical protein